MVTGSSTGFAPTSAPFLTSGCLHLMTGNFAHGTNLLIISPVQCQTISLLRTFLIFLLRRFLGVSGESNYICQNSLFQTKGISLCRFCNLNFSTIVAMWIALYWIWVWYFDKNDKFQQKHTISDDRSTFGGNRISVILKSQFLLLLIFHLGHSLN